MDTNPGTGEYLDDPGPRIRDAMIASSRPTATLN